MVAPANPDAAVAPTSEWATLPNVDLMRQTSYLPSDLDCRLVLTKSPNAFSLHGGLHTAPEITWATAGENSCRLFLKRVYPPASVREHVTKLRLAHPFRYNMTMSRVQKRTIGLATSVDLSDLLNGPRPDVVCVMFMNTLATTGEYPAIRSARRTSSRSRQCRRPLLASTTVPRATSCRPYTSTGAASSSR